MPPKKMSQPAPGIHTETPAEPLAEPTSKKGMAKAVAKMSQPAPNIRTESSAEPMAEPMAEQTHKDREAKAVATIFEPGSNIEIPAVRTFTCFPRLPAELRMKVWKYTSHVTRNIDISTKGLYPSNQDLNSQAFVEGAVMLYYYASYCPSPSILQVCNESRTEALKYYQLDFASENVWNLPGTSKVPLVHIATPPRIYINWQVDRLCVMHPTSFENDDNEEIFERTDRARDFVALCVKNELKHFAINSDDTDFALNQFFCIPWAAQLEELILFDDIWDVYGKLFKKIDFVDVPEKDENDDIEWQCKIRALDMEFEKGGCGGPELLRCCNLQLHE